MRLPTLLLAVCACAVVAGCRKVPQPPPGTGSEQPSLLFQGFSARASHRGRLVWEARAARARVFDTDQRALAEDVAITYYVNGKVVSRGYADRARMDLKRYDMEAEGHVRLRGQNGVRLFTSRLRWDNTAQRADSDARVRLVREGTVLTGKGFSADRELRDVRLREDVQAEAVSLEQLRREAAEWPERKP